MKVRSILLVGALSVCVTASTFATAQFARADTTQQQLMPDPDAYCSANPPLQTQVRESGWTVLYTGLQGNPNVNNWRCSYRVFPTVPLADLDGNDGSMPLPAYTQIVPTDWEALCAAQYDGSTAQWVGLPGPLMSAPGPFAAPWLCLGAPDAQYDQSETVNGPVGMIN